MYHSMASVTHLYQVFAVLANEVPCCGKPKLQALGDDTAEVLLVFCFLGKPWQ